MKGSLTFIRSMKFGLILLILVILCSLAGSLVPQDRPPAWYIDSYPNGIGTFVTSLGIHRLFGTWYFIALIGLLCVNLSFCTFVRLTGISKIKDNALLAAEDMRNAHEIGVEAASELRERLGNMRFKQREANGVIVFYKNTSGYYGSFIVHLSLLLILVFGSLVLWLSEVTDYTLVPNETKVLEDGTQLTLDSFRVFDDTGRTDYAGSIRVRSPDGRESGSQEIKVNHPFSFRSYKYYQHSFGTCGSVTALNTLTGGWDVFYLTERCFLSSDRGVGVWFEALFPAYVTDEHGHITPLAMQTVIYPNPVYYVLVSDTDGLTARFVFPGETILIGSIEFTFNDPAYFSGIRVKRVPFLMMELLFASFVLMTLGFWLCFFNLPVVVTIGEDSYKTGNHNGIRLEIERFLNDLKESPS